MPSHDVLYVSDWSPAEWPGTADVRAEWQKCKARRLCLSESGVRGHQVAE
jgi:hypothetical protein